MILVVAHAVNVVLEVLFVYGFGWGLAGSAWGTVIAQAGMGGGVRRACSCGRAGSGRRRARMRSLMRIGTHIAVRTTALLAPSSSPRRCSRASGPASLAAHQIAFQLFVFLALVLDAVAIAAQVMVGRMLGAGDAAGARAAARRMIGWSVVAGTVFGLVLLALARPHPARLHLRRRRARARGATIWPLFALMMPANGAVFALDGILIGAGDTRFLMWGMLAAAAVYVPVALLALAEGWGIVGVWCGLVGLILVRLLTCGARFAGGRWALVGAPA